MLLFFFNSKTIKGILVFFLLDESIVNSKKLLACAEDVSMRAASSNGLVDP